MSKTTKWKSFDFGETVVNDKKMPSRKRRKLNEEHTTCSKVKVNVKQSSDINFQKNLEPKTLDDLIVHNKKVQEVEGWLKFTTSKQERERTKTDMLLITGPTGSGKTSTVQVLCKVLNVEVSEWINPVDQDFETIRGPGQIARFLEFFSESKYCSLFSSGGSKRIILVKDFPNTFIRDPKDFSELLREISFKRTVPVIFICTDSSSVEVNLQRTLFPENILMELSITHLSFNACAPTLLKKGFTRIVGILQAYPEQFSVPPQSTIEAIIASSAGDIRCAINQLCLASVIGGETSAAKTEVSKRKKSNLKSTGAVKMMVKDETLGLFHGLGRVLNPKRRPEGLSWRLDCNVDKLIDEFSVQPSMFVSYIFENYLKYFGDLKDAEKAANTLSVSSRLLENWDNHETLVMALWTAVLGLMVHNEHRVSKWNQIRAPRKIANNRTLENGRLFNPTDGFYINLINKSDKYHCFNCDDVTPAKETSNQHRIKALLN